MDAENYRFLKQLDYSVDIETYKVGVDLFLEVATRNGMHDVWYALINGRGRFLGDGRDHPIADEVRQRLKNACMNYDGRNQKLYRSGPADGETVLDDSAQSEGASQEQLPPSHQAGPVRSVYSEETLVARQLGPNPRRLRLPHSTL